MLALLDEESRFPRATDRSLAGIVRMSHIMNIIIFIDLIQDKFHDHFSSSPYYTPPKDGGPCFTFTHYAGPVSHKTVVCESTLNE